MSSSARRLETVAPTPPPNIRSSATQDEEDTSAFDFSTPGGRIASFGPFILRATERILEKNGKPLKIGSRALDILLTLLEHAPQIVGKRDLIRRTWGELVVAEVNLRVHVAALRKGLGGEPRGGYITNVPGRGYCFAGEVTWTAARTAPSSTPTAATPLPREPLQMVGRDNVVRELTAELKKHRFLSIVGPGGIGKTTIALALAHRMLLEFQGAVHFLDLAAVQDPRLIASMLASELGLVALAGQPLPVILSSLREQRMLLVFDSCEHAIEDAANLTENIFRDAPQVHILATSRQTLRAEGEHVHHLPPLAYPPPNADSLTAAEALGYPAVQLFVKQVATSGHALELTDADAPIVAEICRRLDGIALALELAASRVRVHGIQGTASLLDKHFRLLWRGRRTALPRHQTLNATLDWSYNLLSTTERLILRRLAVFVGGFSLEAALHVAAESIDPAEFIETLATLVEKSLVTLDGATTMRYRLLDTARTYAWGKLTESGEHATIARRHCEHIVRVLEQLEARISIAPQPEQVAIFAANLCNVRAALDWCFSDEGDTALGVRLVAASACHFFHQHLLTECVTWSERAIHSFNAASQSTRLELELQVCLGLSLIVTKGNVAAVQTAFVRGIELAECLTDAPTELLALSGLYTWHCRSGDFRRLEALTNRIETVAKKIADPAAAAISRGIAVSTCYFVGDQRKMPALARIARAVGPVQSSKLNLASFGHPERTVVAPTLARSLWMLGYPDQAAMMTAEAIQEANDLNHPFSLCYVLMSCVIVALDTGDWLRAEELICRLSSIATKHHLSTYARASVGWQGRLAVSRGDLSRGIQLLQTALTTLHEDGYELYRPKFSVPLAEGLAESGQCELAYSTVCEALTWAEARGHTLNIVELLRVKGEILNLMTPADDREGEPCLMQSLHLAHDLGLLSLELRSAISIARLWAGRGATNKALELLTPIFGRFSEGFQTRDLLAAINLLHELRSRNSAVPRSSFAPSVSAIPLRGPPDRSSPVSAWTEALGLDGRPIMPKRDQLIGNALNK
jgi:predicted ATPase/DNA-binding winged helix-turn-helix (wHTH) protein